MAGSRRRKHEIVFILCAILDCHGFRELSQILGDTFVKEVMDPRTPCRVKVSGPMVMNGIDLKTINTIRFLSIDAVEKAKSGHPGLPMGAAPMAYTLWKNHLCFSPKNPLWFNRDRFVLSAGHGSMLLYSLLHLFTENLPMEELKNFRQWGSKTPGHPEVHITPGVEATTGPLGQGISNAVGMAMAERYLAETFNREKFEVVDHYTYVLASDGDLMEGVAQEACSLAGHLKLGKLIVLYDDNSITIDGSTGLAFSEDLGMRFKAYGWQVIEVRDGNSLDEVNSAILLARKVTTKPTLIQVKTRIGYGSPNKVGTAAAHGSPLGEKEVAETRRNLKWPEEKFLVPLDVREALGKVQEEKARKETKWKNLMEQYRLQYPEDHDLFMAFTTGKLLKGIDTDQLYAFTDKSMATRKASGKILTTLTKEIRNLVGGSADLAESTSTLLKDEKDFEFGSYGGRNIRFGLREHAMGAILNGMTLHGGLKVYGATFLVFSDYMRPAIRLAALSKLDPVFIFTHDSIGLGEDGPTHQPIEHVASLQLIPGLQVIRPADAKETAAAWIKALETRDRPTALILTRQDLPVLKETSKDAEKGGYILIKEKKKKPDMIIMASGSEVRLAVEAQKTLKGKGIDVRVVSMPSVTIFKEQKKEYIEEVLPKDVKLRIAVEAGVGAVWNEFLGRKGKFIGLSDFGHSAPGAVVMEKLGFTAENITETAMKMMK